MAAIDGIASFSAFCPLEKVIVPLVYFGLYFGELGLYW
jgi:hypothetical protein